MGSLGTGFTYGCEPYDVGTGNVTPAFAIAALLSIAEPSSQLQI